MVSDGSDKEARRKAKFLHTIDPSKLGGLNEFAEWLESILHNPCRVWEDDGKEFLIEIRVLVERLQGLRIEIYPDEHAPPHFHVKSPNVDASFTIESCEKLVGSIDNDDFKKVRFWHKKSKPLLIEAWNSTRPTECQVGPYEGA